MFAAFEVGAHEMDALFDLHEVAGFVEVEHFVTHLDKHIYGGRLRVKAELRP